MEEGTKCQQTRLSPNHPNHLQTPSPYSVPIPIPTPAEDDKDVAAADHTNKFKTSETALKFVQSEIWNPIV